MAAYNFASIVPYFFANLAYFMLLFISKKVQNFNKHTVQNTELPHHVD